MSDTPMTRHIARFALSYSKSDVPPEAWEIAKHFFTDVLGCIIAGANETPSKILTEYAKENNALTTCDVIGQKDLKLDPYNTILINGTSAHFHDVDDVVSSTDGHPSVAVLPAVLTAAQMVGATGEETLMAYVTGIQVIKLVGVAFNKNGRYYSIGWHSTPTLGIFGAVAAIGRLFALTEDQLTYALGIAASESAGLKGNFGTMVKPFHAGKCGADAYLAVQIAKKGFVSNPAILEGNDGYAHVTTKTVDMDDFLEALEKKESVFLKPGLNMKPWPCCKQNHSCINAVQNLREKYKITADDVDHVECRMQPLSYDCLKYTAPVTKLQGKFSIQYNVAVALLYGDVTLEDYDGVDIEDEQVIALMPKIHMEIDDTIAGGKYGNGKYDSILRLHLKDGRVLQEWVVDAKGDPTNPMTKEEVTKKFTRCAKRALRAECVEELADKVWHIDELATAQELLDAINAAAK